jgi:predicted NBD/HSP70 family sugar kinase
VYEFTLAFRHLDLDNDATLRSLAKVLPSAHWLTRNGEVHVTVAVDASDPVEAAFSVEAMVRQVAPTAQASHVVEDLVAIPDIAARVGVDREAVRLWVNGTRGPGSFPPPRGVVGDRLKIWDWPTVNQWLSHRNGKVVDSNRLLTAREAALVDSALCALPEGTAAGVAITPHRVVGVLTDYTGVVLARLERKIPSPGTPRQAVLEVVELLSELHAAVDGVDSKPRATVLGIHVGGHVDQHGKIVLAPRYQDGKDWKATDLRALLEREIKLPTVVLNDANALALYERYFGVGLETRNFVVVLLNVGVGAGIVVNGQLLTGWQGAAGEVGHLVVALGGFNCTCGNDDCLECVAGIANLVRAIDDVTGQDISRLDEALKMAEHDDAAQEKLRSAGEALGRASSMVLNLINPSHLVLYAPRTLLEATGKSAIFMQEMKSALERHSFSTTKECKVVLRARDEESGAIGAAIGALRAHG